MNKRIGIKHLCVLETFYFDPYENFTADLYHDIFQESLMNILRIVLNELKPDYLSLDSLNLRINNFAYGRDIGGKPSEIDFERIKDKSHGHFKQKYDQMFTLYPFLPLMIYDAVPFNEIWNFLVDFFDLIASLLSPTFVESDYQLLGVLFRKLLQLILFVHLKVVCVFSVVSDEHLETLVQLFPSESVRFRQHKLIHYPRVLKSSGPLLYQSVLRYERKHQFFKRLTHNICNFKNICKSLAIRHQVNEYFNWKDDIPIKQNIFPCCKQGFVSDSLISTNEK